ncbi:hypoxia induced protein conserved region-domain-containing protein [Mucor mucedo]|uniref:hypoxia induced protein conserved region-domain-containing protein n=1 Tax=Mucor mucedo TaxID=29922 RepID=UPI00221F4663|nr:hypoxia induced protein conserved region-domain-containing protein [Mucor mucedo]KAI7869595.1 hypoxia induced protein conserved region-domain-containing protein [Mucor mucedo]
MANEYTKQDIERMRQLMDQPTETALDKIQRKMIQEPLVPAGVALTTFALVAATFGVKTGNRRYTNNMFRLRVAAQTFTILAMVGGSIYFQQKEKKEAAAAAAAMEEKKSL